MIETLIERIQHRLQTGSYPNEAAISFSVVMPILRALGWDDSDPEQVMPEYASGGRRVSITDGDHQPPPKADEGIPFVTISNLDENDGVKFEKTFFVPQDYFDGLNSP